MSTELASPEQLADQSRPVDQQISQDLLENGPLLDSTAVVVGIGSDTLPEPRIGKLTPCWGCGGCFLSRCK